MKISVFRKINKHYLLICSEQHGRLDLNVVKSSPRFVHAEALASLKNEQIYESEDLRNFLAPHVQLLSKRYVVLTVDSTVALVKYAYPHLFLRIFLKWYRARIIAIAEGDSNRFTRDMHREMEQALFGSPAKIGAVVSAFARYLFFDHYSLWIYNSFTRTFTCSASSIQYDRDFISFEDGTSLNDTVAEGYQAESREPDFTRAGFVKIEGMKWLSRVKLNFGTDGSFGVITFYSRILDFGLRDDTKEIIINFFTLKYQGYLHQDREEFLAVSSNFLSAYSPGQLNAFLQGLVGEICRHLHFEACSIFLVSSDRQYLDLVATKDLIRDGEPTESVRYKMDSKCLTTKVFSENTLIFSYSLDNERLNSHVYDEKTQIHSANWIGIPLRDADEPRGVLRVKNKFHVEHETGNVAIRNFRHIDFLYLQEISKYLSYLFRMERIFAALENGNKLISSRLSDIDNFNRVFMHEIRTPISTFNMAPERIKRSIEKQAPRQV